MTALAEIRPRQNGKPGPRKHRLVAEAPDAPVFAKSAPKS